MKLKILSMIAAIMVVVAVQSAPLFAQAGPGGPGAPGAGGPGGPGGQGQRNFDPSQIQQMMNDQIKQQLGVSDGDWTVIGPKLEKVQTLQADTGGGVMGMLGMATMFRGRGGGGNGGGFTMNNQAATPAQQKLQDLQSALQNDASTPQEIKVKLAAVREARAKAKADLEKARKELIDLLTPKQEAILFSMGIVE